MSYTLTKREEDRRALLQAAFDQNKSELEAEQAAMREEKNNMEDFFGQNAMNQFKAERDAEKEAIRKERQELIAALTVVCLSYRTGFLKKDAATKDLNFQAAACLGELTIEALVDEQETAKRKEADEAAST